MQNAQNETSKNVEKSDAASGNQDKFLCPKCQSENTQKVEMAFLSGRFKGTPLEVQIRPPKAPELFPDWFIWISGLSGTLLVWWLYKLFNGMPWTMEFLRWVVSLDFWESLAFMAKVLGLGVVSALFSCWCFYTHFKKRKDAVEMSHDYLVAKDTWKHGYICHKCGHRYLIRT